MEKEEKQSKQRRERKVDESEKQNDVIENAKPRRRRNMAESNDVGGWMPMNSIDKNYSITKLNVEDDDPKESQNTV
jgi:hypothetical protein